MECVVVLAPWEIAIVCLGRRKVPLQMDPIYARFNQRWGGGGGGGQVLISTLPFYYHHLQMIVFVLVHACVF